MESFQSSPITEGVLDQDPELLQSLIDAGADVNADLGNGWTPLHLAFDLAIDGMIQTDAKAPEPNVLENIKTLIANGADINKRNSDNKTALDAINTYAGTPETFNFLMAIFRPIIPLIDQKIQYREKRNG